jgi:hypothetical protein
MTMMTMMMMVMMVMMVMMMGDDDVMLEQIFQKYTAG